MIDKSDFYPSVPGSSCDPDAEMLSTGQYVSKPGSTATAVTSQTLETESKSEPTREPSSSGHSNTDNDHALLSRFFTGFSNIISWILVPLLVPVYATILILNLTELDILPANTKLIFTAVVFVISSVIPMILVLLLKRMNIVDDLGLNGRKERLIPYIISIVSFVGIALFFHIKGAPLWMTIFYAGGALAALINMIVNFLWKISAHAAGMAGVVAILIVIGHTGIYNPQLQWWIMGTILLTGLLGTARVWLGRHTVMQVLCGYICGFLAVYIPELIFCI